MFSDFIDICKGVVKRIFDKITFVHDIYVDPKRVRLSLGIKITGVFSAIVEIKIKNDISLVNFFLNGTKYKLYLASNKLTTSLKATLIFIKALITGNKTLQEEFKDISLSKKEYKSMKNRLKKIKYLKKHPKINLNKQTQPKGMLVIKLGKRKEEEKTYFDPSLAW